MQTPITPVIGKSVDSTNHEANKKNRMAFIPWPNVRTEDNWTHSCKLRKPIRPWADRLILVYRAH